MKTLNVGLVLMGSFVTCKGSHRNAIGTMVQKMGTDWFTITKRKKGKRDHMQQSLLNGAV